MKTIYYRERSSTYRKGFFITYDLILGFILFGLFVFYLLYFDGNVERVSLIVFLSIAGLIFYYLLDKSFKSEISIGNLSSDLDNYSYLKKKLKKNKRELTERDWRKLELMCDYEFNAAITHSDELLKYYEKSLDDITRLEKYHGDEIDVSKRNFLIRGILHKIKILKGMAKYKEDTEKKSIN